jgi:hypothetical protein
MNSADTTAAHKRRGRLLAGAIALSLPLQILGLRLVAESIFPEKVTPSIQRSLDGTSTFVMQSSLSSWFTFLFVILIAANTVAFSIVLAKSALDEQGLTGRSISALHALLGIPVLLLFLLAGAAFFTVLITPFHEFREINVLPNSLQLTSLASVRTIDRVNVAVVDVVTERVSQNDDRLVFAVLIHLRSGECVRSVKIGPLKPRSAKMQQWQNFFGRLRHEIGDAHP